MVISRFSDSYNCLLCSLGHSLRIMEDECVNMSVSPNGLNLANIPVALNASSSSCSEFGGLGCLGLSALAAPSQLGTFPGNDA